MLPECRYGSGPLRLSGLNHVSKICKNLQRSVAFYEHVLNFVPIQRPSSFEFEGAWLFNPMLGVGFHLIQSDDGDGEPSRAEPQEINPKSDHLSFQSDSLADVKRKLTAWGVPFLQESVVEGGIHVTQIFFHDPDGNMIEICNCDCLPIQPLDSRSSLDSGNSTTSAACHWNLAPQLPHAQRMQSSVSSSSAAQLSADRERGSAEFKRAGSPDSPLPAGCFTAMAG